MFNSKDNILEPTQIEVYANEAYAETFIKQIYFNNYQNNIELSVELPNKKGVQFVDFEVEIKDKKVKSKLITKEKAEEKYTDTIAQGNVGIYCEYKNDLDKYIIHLGNIEPNTKVYFKSHFMQSIISNDLNYLFRLMDHFPFPKFGEVGYKTSDNYKIKINFQTSTPITISKQKIEGDNIIIKNIFLNDKTKYEIEIDLKTKINNNSNYYSNSLFSGINNNSLLVSFEFQTKDYKQPKLYKQYDPINDETTYLLSYFKIINNNDNINRQIEIEKSFPGLYYFIIDQSGSMSGKPISLVIQTLKVFMLSLPKGSYYQLIGFGSNYKLYSDKPLSYTKENINKTILDIENLNKDLGGTDIFQPLEYVYNNLKNNENLNLPQNIFILTDGYTGQKEKALDLIEKNNNDCQVYSYGIGNSFDYDFIRTAGECGHGAFKFINNIENLNVAINEQLNKCMRAYFDKVKFSVENKNNGEIIYDFYRNKFILENQLVNYLFIVKGKNDDNIEIKCDYNQEGKSLNEVFNFDRNKILNLKNGNILSKIIMNNLIQKGKGEDFSKEEKIKKIAKKYQILCQYTSLFAEIENTEKISETNLQSIITSDKNKGESGNNKNNNSYKGESLFGNNNSNNNNSYKGESLFGNNNSNNNNSYKGESLFGNNNSNTNSYQNQNNLFGNNNNYSYQGGGLFGNNNNTYQNQNNLFGNNNNKSYQGEGFFGNNNNTYQNQNNLFGNNNNKSCQGEGLFGNNNDNSSPKPMFFNNNNILEEKEIQSSGLFGNNNDIKKLNDEKQNIPPSFGKEDHNIVNNNDNPDKILENIILNFDIVEESWEENQITKYVLDLKKSIYEQVKNLVGNNNIAVTFMILFYILNDRKERVSEYLNIINKAKRFLFCRGFSYELIFSKIKIN